MLPGSTRRPHPPTWGAPRKVREEKENTAALAGLEYDLRADLAQEFEIQLNFKDKYAAVIVKSGCFKNQHQLPPPSVPYGAVYNPTRRALLEDAMAGLHLEATYSESVDAPAHLLRPKYAYLSPKHAIAGHIQSRPTSLYGNVFAVLKDKVKDRTTFTASDSHNLYKRVATNLSEGVGTSYSELWSIDGLAESALWGTHSLSLGGIPKLPKDKGLKSWDYLEAQIWGSLCMGDVQYFLVNCPFFEIASHEAIRALLNSGVPVYQCVDASAEKREEEISKLGEKGRIAKAANVGPSAFRPGKRILN